MLVPMFLAVLWCMRQSKLAQLSSAKVKFATQQLQTDSSAVKPHQSAQVILALPAMLTAMETSAL
jgi:hypothetical protein